ncbi:MAG: phytanoyl-CoA dioxygenase family protein [Rhodovulum sp.]
MRLTDDQIKSYRRDGFLLLPDVFAGERLAALQAARDRIAAMPARPWNFLEAEGGPVRAYNACHWDESVFADLVSAPECLTPARQILGGEVYLHQFKMNPKAPFGTSTGWGWHQDYVNWRDFDGMPENRALNVAVLLDDATEVNGPLYLIPGSHRETALGQSRADRTPGVTATEVGPDDVRRLADAAGIVSATAAAGGMLLFDPMIVHASAPNISPWTRFTVYLTYNHAKNRLTRPTRPEHVAARDATPLRLAGEAA